MYTDNQLVIDFYFKKVKILLGKGCVYAYNVLSLLCVTKTKTNDS